MQYLRNWALVLLASGLVGCEQHPSPLANPAPPGPAANPVAGPVEVNDPELGWGVVRDSLYFGRYLTAHDGEERIVFYKPHPDSAWLEISRVLYPNDFELDTANVDRAGLPELLLTVPLRWAGNRGGSTVSTRYVLRVGQQIDTLFNVLVNCADYHDGIKFFYNIDRTQHVTAGYGFVRVGPVRTTCEQHHLPHPEPCRCSADILAAAGNPRFARPGRYRWQQGRLQWVGSR
ncbi:MAG: hypothetical protein ACRYFX_15090 [Janthinobacterium lividum]